MGRSSKPEQPAETPQYQENHANTSGGSYGAQQQPATQSRVVSESESIARDIKEGRLSGFVGHGTVLTGETNFQAMLRVDGHLTGRVASESGTLIVGSNGRVDADVMVAAAMINGTVNGDIIALEKVELGRTARVVGNIQSPRLVIEDGAVLEGACSMMRAQEALAERAAEAQKQSITRELPPAMLETGYEETEEETFSEAATS